VTVFLPLLSKLYINCFGSIWEVFNWLADDDIYILVIAW